jgi:hypothetical protein
MAGSKKTRSKTTQSTGARKKTPAASNRRGLGKKRTTLKKSVASVKKTITEETTPKTASASTPRSKSSASTRKSATPRKTAPNASGIPQLTPEERYRMICEAAYFLAEKRGFVGDTANDWFEAERQIENLYPTKPKRRTRKK